MCSSSGGLGAFEAFFDGDLVFGRAGGDGRLGPLSARFSCCRAEGEEAAGCPGGGGRSFMPGGGGGKSLKRDEEAGDGRRGSDSVRERERRGCNGGGGDSRGRSYSWRGLSAEWRTGCVASRDGEGAGWSLTGE